MYARCPCEEMHHANRLARDGHALGVVPKFAWVNPRLPVRRRNRAAPSRRCYAPPHIHVGAGSMHQMAAITELLNAANSGDVDARETVFTLIYDELKACARRRNRALTPGASLSPTELVSEIFLRLTDHQIAPFKDRGHFFALAARAMRQIMVDLARQHASSKRGGDIVFTTLDNNPGSGVDPAAAIELDAALSALAERDPRVAQVVELHFFGGLGFAEIGVEMGMHERTVRRDWELARAYLRTAMNSQASR